MNPKVSIIIKIKNGSLKNHKQYLNLPKKYKLTLLWDRP